MFERAIFETTEGAPRTRAWTTMVSFGMQMVAVGLLILLPLIYTEAIPNLHISEAPPVPPAPRMPDHVKIVAVDRGPVGTNLQDGVLVVPRGVPPKINKVVDPLDADIGGGGPSIGVPGGDMNATARQVQNWARLIPPPPPAMPKPVVEQPKVRPSVLLEGYLIRRIEPVYPNPARIARIQGPVVIKAIVDAQGRIQHLQAMSGNPLLITAAVEAVSQWRYRPYVLNGTPIEVETQVTVNFMLR